MQVKKKKGDYVIWSLGVLEGFLIWMIIQLGIQYKAKSSQN